MQKDCISERMGISFFNFTFYSFLLMAEQKNDGPDMTVPFNP